MLGYYERNPSGHTECTYLLHLDSCKSYPNAWKDCYAFAAGNKPHAFTNSPRNIYPKDSQVYFSRI